MFAKRLKLFPTLIKICFSIKTLMDNWTKTKAFTVLSLVFYDRKRQEYWSGRYKLFSMKGIYKNEI